MPVVIQGSLIRDLSLIFRVLSGACLFMLFISCSWNRLNPSLASNSDSDSGQFTPLMSCLILSNANASNFLCFTVLSPFRDLFMFLKFATIGRWSLISSTIMYGIWLLWAIGLAMILSIKLAVLWVTLVGLEMQGMSPFLRLDSRNSFVCGWEFAFSRSRLWSIPIIISWCLFFFRLAIRLLYSLRKVLTLLLGGLYPDTSSMFFVSVLSSNTQCSSRVVSTFRSDLILDCSFEFDRMYTPPPILSIRLVLWIL